MQPLDLSVVQTAIKWLNQQQTVWLCSVASTFGSSPRAPGSLMVANQAGEVVGSLSGGCVEEDFIERIKQGEFSQRCTVLQYGGADNARTGVQLPCDGVLQVLVEQLTPSPEAIDHLQIFQRALRGETAQTRRVDTATGNATFIAGRATGPKVEYQADNGTIAIKISPVARLIIAGVSPVAVACADFAVALGFEVIVCDPRAEVAGSIVNPEVTFEPILPSLFIAQADNSHTATAVVALTHDPRIDDLAMIEAVRTPAFYIGVMGSQRTSANRAERLRRSGGLNDEQVARIQMPIGLALGSKTPAEIALAVMADVVRVLRGRPRDGL
ncbi:XdhC family protein [Halioxenophilus aromaticivorans]|uniref:XdhC family protein n=1 Tax=Halioxenophilus aromaticivorans TaxID=1306992 RepID=A0AAV3U5Z5_9ALTE